jgi:hypothetical protein
LTGRIVVTEYISVDGVIQAPSGTERFERNRHEMPRRTP